MIERRANVVVVGGGLIGLATAAELVHRRPEWSVVVFEKEDAPGRHQSGRNSGVVHSGVYYAPGSLKASLCRQGRELLRDFCAEERIPYDVCGKVIVATDPAEIPALEKLHSRAQANGVAAERIGSDALRDLEPHCAGVAALHIPETALVDFTRVAEALVGRIERAGSELRLSARVTSISETGQGVRVTTDDAELLADRVVACAGVHADALAGGQSGETRILPFRGDYFALNEEARRLCRNLIYPVPDPRFPFLGVHVNRRPDGQVWAGPNAVVALAREGYRRRDVNPRDAWETLSYPGFLRLVRRHYRLGALEFFRDHVKRAYAAQARRYLPELSARDLEPAPAGIRAQAVARDGTLVDDFLFSGTERVLHVRNAPSPGATSCLSIARHIVDRALGSSNG